MTNLKSISGMNQYCGPAVLSALTGRSTDECASVISRINGKQIIKAVQMNELIKALDMLGFKSTLVDWNSYTLFGTFSTLATHPGFYVILVPKHVVAVEVTAGNQIFLIDNHTKEPINAAGSARLSQRVEGVYLVTPKPAKPIPVFLRDEIVVAETGIGMISIRLIKHYEIPADNQTIKLGQFQFQSEEQLIQIIGAITTLRKNPSEKDHLKYSAAHDCCLGESDTE